MRGTLPLKLRDSSTFSSKGATMPATKKSANVVTKKSTLVSITDAQKGWNAVFFDDGEVWFEPIACFALCKRGTDAFVGSIVSQDSSGLVIAEENGNFLGIAPPGETQEQWEQSLEEANNMEDDDPDLEDKDDEDNDVVVTVEPRRKRKIIKN